MTTAVNDTIEQYEISGTGPYAFSFRIFNDSDLTVVALSTATPPAVVPLTLSSHYTVSGANGASGGTVTLQSGAATTYAGYTLDIRSNTPANQPTNFRNMSRWLPESGEDAFDYLSRQIQDINRRLDLTVRFPDNMTARGEMTPIQSWVSKYLGVSAAGALEPVLLSSTAISQSILAELLHPTEDDENTFGAVPINKIYRPGELKRYAAGDGVTDDTDGVQGWVNYLCGTHTYGRAQAGTYLIDDTIDFPEEYGWGIIGEGRESTIFKQNTDNIPIFNLGASAGTAMHSYLICDIGFTYTNSQPAANTAANPILFSDEGYQGTLQRLTFSRGTYGIKVVAGVAGPWGQDWDILVWGSGMTGGAMDWTGAVNAVPNNKWGRFFVTATNMTGPIFKNIKGYNWTWDTLELIDLNNAQWISLQAGSILVMGALKMEVGSYSGSPAFDGSALIYAPSGTVLINSLTIGGTTAEFDFGAPRTVFAVTSGTFKVEAFHTELTAAPVDFYIADVDSSSLAEIRYTLRGTYPVPYTYVGGSASAEYLTVYPDINTHLSADKGDANYTITNGDPSTIFFETTLTAARTVALPNTDGIVFNGLRYKVISNGAVNGANTIAVKYGASTLHTLSADNTSVEVMWRRGAGWIVSDLGAVP